jgi:hypothetical protein
MQIHHCRNLLSDVLLIGTLHAQAAAFVRLRLTISDFTGSLCGASTKMTNFHHYNYTIDNCENQQFFAKT